MVKKILIIMLLIVILLPGSFIWGAGYEGEEREALSDGEVFASLRIEPDIPYKVGTVVGVVFQPYSLVKDMLVDFSNFSEIFDRVLRSEWVVKKEDKAIVYGELDVPLIKDMWFLLDVVLEEGPKETRIKWANNHDLILLGNYVKANKDRDLYHLRENHGILKIEPFCIEGQDAPVALVTFQISMYSPSKKWSWLLNFLAGFALPGIIDDIRKAADDVSGHSPE